MERRWKAERHFVCFRSPLKRMTVGMLLASVAFVAAALVQLEIDVSTAAASTQTLTRHAVNSSAAVSFLENPAGFLSRR